MKNKITNTVNWVLGIVLCGLGIALCTKASFGLSMIAAPPYILHVRLSQYLPWFTQGTAEYFWEAAVLIIGCIIIRRFRIRYLLSFITAVLSGLVIDFWLFALGGNGVYTAMPLRIAAFTGGILFIALAIAFVFRTDLPPQVYELIVTEISDKFGFEKSRTKLVNDLIMLAVTGLLAFTLTRDFTGIGAGTVIAAFVNAPLIKFFGTVIDKIEKNTDRTENKK